MTGPQEDTIDTSQQDSSGASLDFFDATTAGLLDSLPSYVILIDRHHRILLANKAVRDQLGIPPEEIIGGYCPRVVHGIEEGEYEACPLGEAVETQAPVEHDHYDENLNRWLRIAIYPTNTRTPDGEEIYFHMILDITEQKQAQKELANSEEKYRLLLEELLNGSKSE